MYACTLCEQSFDSPQKLGGHRGSHNRGELYRRRRAGEEKKTCLFCGAETKNAKYCSTACMYKRTHDEPAVVNGDALDITKGELFAYRLKQTTCEICGKPSTVSTGGFGGRVNKLSVDHCHAERKFRGLLCVICNTQLGWYERNEEQVKQYLVRARSSDV